MRQIMTIKSMKAIRNMPYRKAKLTASVTANPRLFRSGRGDAYGRQQHH